MDPSAPLSPAPSLLAPVTRRRWLRGAAAGPLALAVCPPARSQGRTKPAAGRPQQLVQLVDADPTQQELARDYATGLRLAWAQRRAEGQVLPQLVSRPVDLQRAGAVAEALQQLKADDGVAGTVGIVGDTLAVQVLDASAALGLKLAHLGPWMADDRHDARPELLPLFPSRGTQLKQALATVRGMGLQRITVVRAGGAQTGTTAPAGGIDTLARPLGLALETLAAADARALPAVADALARQDSGLVLLLGGSAEMAVLTQAMAARRLHRFVLGLSDVDPATLVQMNPGPVPLILTQVVPPPASSPLPLVADYRAWLKRLFDEAPSPVSLAGMVAGLGALEAWRRCGPTAGRESLLAEVQRRSPMVLGGFRLDFASAGRRGSGYVTHTLMRPDGTLVG